MDIGKQILHADARRQRTKDVVITFVDSLSFLVLKKQMSPKRKIKSKNIKYFGRLNPDSCTCQSFYHGNSEFYQSTHPQTFECKHIMRAKEIRYG